MNWHETQEKIKKEVPIEEKRRIADEVAQDMGYEGVLDFIKKVVVESEESEEEE